MTDTPVPVPTSYPKPFLKGPVLLGALATSPLEVKPQAFLLGVLPSSVGCRWYFPGWLQQDHPSHPFLQCEIADFPMERCDLSFFHLNLGRLVSMAEVIIVLLPPESLRILTLGIQLPCCEEAQTTWKGDM